MNTRIKVWHKIVITVTGLLLFVAVGLVVATPWLFNEFVESFKPDVKEEEKVIEQAEQYLQMNYPDMKYEISYVFYDSGEQNGNYDYAAVILNTENQKSFRVYENRFTNKVEDNITIQEEAEFIEQVKPKVSSYINEKFGEAKGMSFTPSYDIAGIPALNISLSNNKEEVTEEMFLSLIDYLQNELNIKHALVSIMYDNETEMWVKEF